MKISRLIFTIIFLFAIWVLLTGSLHEDELIVGLFVAIVISLFTGPLFTRRGIYHLHPKRIWGKIVYLFVFFVELVKANVDVAKRVLSPSLPINPGIVRVKTKLTEDMDKLWLANSITLTPGTMTLDIKGDELFIHWIDVQETEPHAAGKIIKGAFERHLGGVE
ncbi:multicomponent Na+:H+ antiporter subunit E [Thermotomaculum hydrothermale]|uniref:Multicomponent Na+:H+ antiporter subunit E n=1 Tax=Thermotomaculum hydrothermale TaxID=981385 RepID=A0A7R6SZ19_9BACT|nr:Na+/H+ antiporter subunit E [Thermotomaculum hydrothermale]BBB33389.1 multicomponent Na+:H+ antiporter subunit E [Thermotomaculum hydrothermale]